MIKHKFRIHKDKKTNVSMLWMLGKLPKDVEILMVGNYINLYKLNGIIFKKIN